MHLEPGIPMATLAGGAEFGSGLATALGVGGAIGPTAMAATMSVAALTGHRGKPYFGQMGGPEMSLLYAANGGLSAPPGSGATVSIVGSDCECPSRWRWCTPRSRLPPLRPSCHGRGACAGQCALASDTGEPDTEAHLAAAGRGCMPKERDQHGP